MFKSSLAKAGSLSKPALAIALVIASSSLAAFAQQNNQPPGSSTSSGSPDKLKEKVTVPELPEYTGKSKYLHGLVYPSNPDNKKGPTYVMVFNTKETESQVHDWWLNSLRQYKWNITYTSADVVQGTNKDGSSCIVQIGGPVIGQAKDDRASYVIRYQAGKP